ncbi:MAG: Uma2 family endonuclease [Ktedonobacterales bacterium]|nr:Uma2 family endonuclease [Ktedonobacterales bacterium]
MAAEPQHQPITVEEYFELDRNMVDAKYEYYDGYVRLMAGGTPQHAMICMNVGAALTAALRGSKCRAFTSDARVQVSQKRYVYPDVTVSCSAEDILDPTAIRSPRVVFEVLSPNTAGFDRNKKSNMYRACPSIEAIVLIDPQQLSVEVLLRDGDFWHHFSYYTADAVVEIPPLGVHIPIAEFYQDIELPPELPLPDSRL